MEIGKAFEAEMGRVVLLTGLLQFPVCFGVGALAKEAEMVFSEVQYLVFTALSAMGLSMGSGQYAGMCALLIRFELFLRYCALVCSISSTMIVRCSASHMLLATVLQVVKLLSEKGETERRSTESPSLKSLSDSFVVPLIDLFVLCQAKWSLDSGYSHLPGYLGDGLPCDSAKLGKSGFADLVHLGA